jgi:hypothetical protein
MKKQIIVLLICLIISIITGVFFDQYASTHDKISKMPYSPVDSYAVGICVFFMAFCITRLLFTEGDNDGSGGGDYFDCTGGAGGIM